MVPYANPSYTTTRDYIDEVVAPALAPYAREFDLLAIAQDVLELNADEQVFTPRDDVDFWEVCYEHRRQ